MQKREHNGWYNYETWIINLWLTNDAGLYDHIQQLTHECEHIASLASALKDLVENLAEQDFPEIGSKACFTSDLFNAALSEVNFDEIARHYFEDFRNERTEQTQ